MERPAVDSFDRLYETARALGEETRFRVYRRLCALDAPTDVTTLADHFSLHPNAIRQHLSRLEQAGLVVSRPDREGSGAGRPRRLYEPSPEPLEFHHPPRPMKALVSVLAQAMDSLPSDRASLVRFGRGWGKSWAGRRKRGNGSAPRSRRGRVQLLARELRAWGWNPSTTREDGGIRLVTERCLFDDVGTATNGRPCALERGLLEGLVESLVNGHATVVETQGCGAEIVL